MLLLFRRLLAVYLLYTASRILFYGFNAAFFPGEWKLLWPEILAGLRFDSFSIVLSNSIFILLSLIPGLEQKKGGRRILKTLYVSCNALFLLFNLIDTGYYRFTRSRSTADLLHQLGGQSDVVAMLPHLLRDYWSLFLLFVMMTGLLDRAFGKYSPAQNTRQTGFLRIALHSILVILLCILGLRGTLKETPLDIIDAGSGTTPGRAAIVLNSPFSIIKTLGQNKISSYEFYGENELQKLYNPVHHFSTDTFRKQNLVVILLESFSRRYTALSGTKSYTPFLDSLMQHSLVCTQAFSNGTKSIEGIPAVLGGMPSWMELPFINSAYANNHQSSFASLLRAEGYQSAFFHGGKNGTMKFTEWARNAGYDHYYGKDEYEGSKNDYDGVWGIYDGPFLQFAARKISDLSEPFHAALFTLSSHHPYRIPAAARKKYEETEDRYAALLYADDALREFFYSAQQTKWFRNTLFVLVADHAMILENEKRPLLSLAIPVLFYKPDNSLKGHLDEVFGQVDILPQVLKIMGYNKKFFGFGMHPGDTENQVWYYGSGHYHLFTDSLFMTYRDTALVGVYNYLRDSLLHHNLRGRFPALEKQVDSGFKARLQTYSKVLNNDQARIP